MRNLAPPEGTGRARGSAGHAGLAVWYKNGCDDDADDMSLKAVSDSITEFERVHEVDLEKEWELMKIIMPRYFDWARANDDFVEIMAVEQEFHMKIGRHKVQGYIDAVVRTRVGTVWLMEHKFNKQVNTRGIDLDPQMSMYLLAARKLGIPATGVLYNVIRVAEGGIAKTSPVERKQVFRNPEGLKLIELELEIQMDEMAELHAKTSNAPKIYRNQTGNCTWDCSFYNACLSMNYDGNPTAALSAIPVVEHVRREVDLGDQVE
jgi:hypothetical protein